MGYQAATVGVQRLIEAVPELKKVANILDAPVPAIVPPVARIVTFASNAAYAAYSLAGRMARGLVSTSGCRISSSLPFGSSFFSSTSS